MTGSFLWVRATVNLHGLRCGEYALVDGGDPYMQELIAGKLLIVEDEEWDDEGQPS